MEGSNAGIIAVVATFAIVGILLFLPRRSEASIIKSVSVPTVADTTSIRRDIDPARSDLPRGLRNRNPGNIRFISGNAFNGQVGQDSAGYGIYDTDQNGIRASVLNLHAYFTRHGLNTVEGIITRWAPSFENDTQSYINSVSRALGVERDEPLEFKSYAKRLIRAIIKHENGYDPYSETTVNAALAASGKI